MKCVGLTFVISAAVIALVAEFDNQKSAPNSMEENAYTQMKSFACASDEKYDFLQLSWRSDAASSRNPGAFEGGGDKIILHFKPVTETLKRAGPSPAIYVSISDTQALMVKVSNSVLPISRLSVNIWRNGKKTIRTPNPDELSAIGRDVSRYLASCIETVAADEDRPDNGRKGAVLQRSIETVLPRWHL